MNGIDPVAWLARARTQELPGALALLVDQVAALDAAVRAGQLAPPAALARLDALSVTDAAGRRWGPDARTGAETGWRCQAHPATRAVPAEPRRFAAAASPVAAGQPALPPAAIGVEPDPGPADPLWQRAVRGLRATPRWKLAAAAVAVLIVAATWLNVADLGGDGGPRVPSPADIAATLEVLNSTEPAAAVAGAADDDSGAAGLVALTAAGWRVRDDGTATAQGNTAVSTLELVGPDGAVRNRVLVHWERHDGRWQLAEWPRP